MYNVRFSEWFFSRAKFIVTSVFKEVSCVCCGAHALWGLTGSLLTASTGFTLSSLSGTAAAATTAPAGLSLGGALTGLGGPLFQSASTAASGNCDIYSPEE